MHQQRYGDRGLKSAAGATACLHRNGEPDSSVYAPRQPQLGGDVKAGLEPNRFGIEGPQRIDADVMASADSVDAASEVHDEVHLVVFVFAE